MDGIHDLGGRQGFGAVLVEDADEPFTYTWEERMWAISRTGLLNSVTIDWFRHCLERMVPTDYLSYRYFNKWCVTYLMVLNDNGTLSLEEIFDRHVKQRQAAAKALSLDYVIEQNRAEHVRFDVKSNTSPAFAVGDKVRTKRRVFSNHTRLPQYATAAEGTVIAHHGTHLLPDRGAEGEHVGDHLYTVEFAASELWGRQANPKDSVCLELWESYLVRPG